MIQAPQMQYMTAQSTAMPTYQAPLVNVPAQNNLPQQSQGVIYNYPTTSCYTQPNVKDKPQYNGVNIEITNPQGQGSVPTQGCYTPLTTQYTIPGGYIPTPLTQNVYQVIPTQPQAQAQQPTVVPAPVITQIPEAQAPAQQPTAQQPIEQQVATDQSAQQPPVAQEAAVAQQPTVTQQPAVDQQPTVETPVVPNANVSPESFAGKLKSSDLDAQKAAIENVAELVKNDDTAGPILLDTQIFDALVEIIDKDTSSLEGPTEEVMKLREKPQDQLTEEEKTKAYTATPLEKAEINKQYALYTISYMQERLNNELQKRTDKGALELKDLPCIDKVVDSAKSNPNPMVRIGALAALSHIARPEYKNDLTTIFDLAKSDEDERVREAATKASESLK